jgi:hypothetical protein
MAEKNTNYSSNWGGARKGAGRVAIGGKKQTVNYYVSDAEKEVMDSIFAALRDKINLEMYDREGLLQDGLGNIKKWIENQKAEDVYMFDQLISRKSKDNNKGKDKGKTEKEGL